MTNNHQSEEAELLAAYQTAVPVSTTRRQVESTVLSVRLTRELLRDLTAHARSLDRPVGTVARELIEDGLVRTNAASPQIVFEAARRAASVSAEHHTGTGMIRSTTQVSQPASDANALVQGIERERKRLGGTQFAVAA